MIHPDDFLLDLRPRTQARGEGLRDEAEANRREPTSVPALLEASSSAGVPRFVDEVRRRTS